MAGYSSSKTNESAILSSGKTSSASKDAKQETKGKCKSVSMDEGRTRTSRIANRDHLIGDGSREDSFHSQERVHKSRGLKEESQERTRLERRIGRVYSARKMKIFA